MRNMIKKLRIFFFGENDEDMEEIEKLEKIKSVD